MTNMLYGLRYFKLKQKKKPRQEKLRLSLSRLKFFLFFNRQTAKILLECLA